jgi:hypothetical protein
MDYQSFVLNHPAKSILGTGNGEQEIRDNSFRFVNTVAIDLRKLGHVEVKVYQKTSGSNSFGYASDILVIDQTLYDCVSSSDTPSAKASFGDVGPGDLSRFEIPDPQYYIPTNSIPTPVPIPIPVPTPVPPTNPLPTYSQWLDETDTLTNAYHTKHGHAPGNRDVGHWGWRRFVEHWKFEDMVNDV